MLYISKRFPCLIVFLVFPGSNFDYLPELGNAGVNELNHWVDTQRPAITMLFMYESDKDSTVSVVYA